MPISVCGCWCGLVHPGSTDVCTAEPVTTRLFITYGAPAQTAMCQGCASELDRLRAEFGRAPKEVS